MRHHRPEALHPRAGQDVLHSAVMRQLVEGADLGHGGVANCWLALVHANVLVLLEGQAPHLSDGFARG